MLATMTSKSQITLPKDIRALLQLEPGDKVAFLPLPDGQIVFSKANKESFSKLRGLLPQPSRAYSVHEMNQAVQEGVAKQHAGA